MKKALQFCSMGLYLHLENLIFYAEHALVFYAILVFKSLILPMFRFLNIIWSSFKMALQEFRSNKLRTFLSLLGITFGIFCIISVLSTISSIEYAVQNDLKSLGNNTIFVDKWQYAGGGSDYPWWKYIKRPTPKEEE